MTFPSRDLDQTHPPHYGDVMRWTGSSDTGWVAMWAGDTEGRGGPNSFRLKDPGDRTPASGGRMDGSSMKNNGHWVLVSCAKEVLSCPATETAAPTSDNPS